MINEPASASSSSNASLKRKGTSISATAKPVKKSRVSVNSKGKSKETDQGPPWPDYFNALFKVYKALNTVLAFCSSRKYLATTFDGIRASVEALLKEPLDLIKVAEIKALLPNLVNFGYIMKSDLLIHRAPNQSRRAKSPDYSSFPHLPSSSDTDIHVLILEFAENSRGKKAEPFGSSFVPPPALTPTAMKKLVESRNERFIAAVDELLAATPSTEDPVTILQAAGRDHIPVNTSWEAEDDSNDPKEVPSPEHRPTIDAVISELKERHWYKGQIVMRKVTDELKAREGFLDAPLSETISDALRKSRSITSLYSHQAEAINAIHSGKHVIVSTSTASGKSIIYQVPMLRFLEEDRDATIMFIYPTKALAQDQKGAAEQLIGACAGLEHLQVATYDGDTPQETRRLVRDNASVIFTNFDMIHASILPHEELWRRFLKNLNLVAVDELHYYADLFGSHVTQVIRRFRRVCAAVGNRRVRFVSCSATISKPLQHMRTIFGIDDVHQITNDGAPAGKKDFLVWNPPLKDPKVPRLGKVSSMVEATGLMRFLMKRGIRVILFCKIRKACELAMKTLRTDLSAEGRLDVLDRVMSYRGGYSPQDRRIIEHEAFSGRLLGIVATNALELGVDIGVLDAVIILGFPMGGIASLRQQAGRAGRRARDALAVYVADSLPVDTYYINNPNELFNRPMDDLIIDLENKIIIEAHLQCAGVEMPISLEDEEYFGPLTKEICQTRLVKDKEGWYHTHPKFMPYPAKHVSLRGIEEERYVLLDVTEFDRGGLARIIEEIEISRAMFEVFEGAVYIHQGLTFVIKEVSHDSMVARLIRADVNWITSPRDFTDVDALQTYRIREIKGSAESTSTVLAFYGRVEVRTIIFGYFKIRNNVIIDAIDIDTLPWVRETVGFWIDVPMSILELMFAKGINSAEAIHAAEHAILNRFAMSADLRTECKAAEKEYKATESKRKRPARLIFYDIPGKSGGVAAKAFDNVSDLVRTAYDVTVACTCSTGCTKCVMSTSCQENSLVSSKSGAELVLRAILGLPVNPDDIPSQGGLEAFETIVAASTVPSRMHIDIEKDE